MGINVVEREGISFAHPARFILVGTMNPEEGDLRPQLLDRFALSVDMRGLSAPAERMAIMERRLAFEADPEGFAARWQAKEQELSAEIARARAVVDSVTYSRRDLHTIAALTASLHVDGHRADLVILKAARAHAAWQNRTRLAEVDIAIAAELALPHRVRRGPFQQGEANLANMQERVSQMRQEYQEAEGEPEPGDDPSAQKKNRP